jgi:hypothetical protein
MRTFALLLGAALACSAQTSVLTVDTSGDVTATGFGSFLTLSTSGSQFLVEGIIGTQPASPVSTHGRLWFDNTGDWPNITPMGVDSSGNTSTMLRVAKGASFGTYTPVYWGVGGNYAPTATLQVYDNTPAPALGLMNCTGTCGGGGGCTRP